MRIEVAKVNSKTTTASAVLNLLIFEFCISGKFRSKKKDSSLSAKKHDKKVYITDIAIEKIPKIEYKGLSQKENEALFRLARMVLMTSKLENDSNEVAITCTLDSDDPMDVIGVSLGEEHSVNICANTVANHLIVSSRMCAVVIMHNHPSTQTLSLEIRLPQSHWL